MNALAPIHRRHSFYDFGFDPFAPFACTSGCKTTPHLMKTDIEETPNQFEVYAELAGFEKGDLKVSFKDGCITISAHKEHTSETKVDEEKTAEKKHPNFLRKERYQGSRSRTFYIGEDVLDDQIEATYESGILSVIIPKKIEPSTAAKEIEIKIA